MTRRDAPVFAQSPLSREPADRKLFPQSEIHGGDRLVNVEIIDPILNVKLRQYYSRSQYTGDTVSYPSLICDRGLHEYPPSHIMILQHYAEDQSRTCK